MSKSPIFEINEEEVEQQVIIAQPEIDRWKQALLSGNEDEAIRLMDAFIAKFGEVVFQWATNTIDATFTVDQVDSKVTTNPFMIAAYHGMLKLAEKFLDEELWPYEPDNYLRSNASSDNPLVDGVTPMIVAVMTNNLRLAELLMRHHVKPSPVIGGTKSEIIGARRRGWSRVVDYLIENISVLRDKQIVQHLELMRAMYYSEPGWNKSIDYDCLKLRAALNEKKNVDVIPEVVTFDSKERNDEYREIYAGIYGPYEEPDHRKDKKSVLKRANTALAQLLRHPDKCHRYLTFLNDEFVRYHAFATGETIQAPDMKHFTFKDIGNTWYPVPDKNYRGNKNHGTLSQYLLVLFRKHGFGDRAVKWLGFIEREAADEMVRRGDFISEATFGAPGLLHGKLSHMIQTAILIFAIENGEIDLEYEENGRKAKLTVGEIIASQVDRSSGRMLAGIWEIVRDTRVYDEVRFGDPHRLQSVLMRDGESLGAKELSHYMINSFCKAFLKSHHATSMYISDLGGVNDFADQLNDLAPNGYNIPYYLQEHGRSYYNRKNSLMFRLFHSTKDENAVEMQINPKDGFMPRSFYRV